MLKKERKEAHLDKSDKARKTTYDKKTFTLLSETIKLQGVYERVYIDDDIKNV